MDKLRIAGGRPLEGEVHVSGAKNAALPIMSAALLTRGKLKLRRVPHLRDIETMMQVLREMGVEPSGCSIPREWSGPASPWCQGGEASNFAMCDSDTSKAGKCCVE